MARSRNQPRGHLALLVIAILALLVMLCVRVDAAPDPAVLDGDDAPAGGLDVDDLEPGPIVAPTWAGRVVPDGRAGDGRASEPVAPEQLARVAAGAPELAQVVAAAWRAAGVAEDPAPSWRLRTRLAALVPWVTVRDGDDASWREVADPTLGHSQVFEVRATWHLDRLLFEPSELRIAAIDVSRRRERRRVATLATRVYYAWLHARAAGPRTLETLELAAELDAMTDGRFSEMMAKRAEPRR